MIIHTCSVIIWCFATRRSGNGGGVVYVAWLRILGCFTHTSLLCCTKGRGKWILFFGLDGWLLRKISAVVVLLLLYVGSFCMLSLGTSYLQQQQHLFNQQRKNMCYSILY